MLKKSLKFIKIMVFIMPLFFLFICMLGVITTVIAGNQNNINSNTGIDIGTAKVSQSVLVWKPEVEQYAFQYGMTQYESLILAVMQQESGGTVADVMQAAEGPFNTQYPHEPNGITDPDYSIQCGIQELKQCIDLAGVKDSKDMQGLSLALQAYNFGSGFISYAKARGGYSIEVVQAFSTQEASTYGWSSYGDVQYAQHVLRYYSIQ